MSARAKIICEEVTEALCVPVSAIFVEGEKALCYIAGPLSYEAREVRVGRQSLKWAEIVEGLEEGETVALSRPDEGEVGGQRLLPSEDAEQK